MQTITKGLLLHGEIDHGTLHAAELEKRLVAAMKVVIAQLPADAADELR